jgi:hypothetical protein
MLLFSRHREILDSMTAARGAKTIHPFKLEIEMKTLD